MDIDTTLQSRRKSKIVLGVDDAVENLTLLKGASEACGYQFIGARSGRECIALLGKIVPKFILLDIQMPELDGFETCRMLRRIPEIQHVPVAFVTMRNTAADVKAAIAAGGDDFIAKPYEMTTLMEKIQYWSARKSPPRLIKIADDPGPSMLKPRRMSLTS